MKNHGKPLKRYGRKTAQGAWKLPNLCAMVTAWFRQRRNTHPQSAVGRIKRHSRLVADVTDRSRVQRQCQQSPPDFCPVTVLFPLKFPAYWATSGRM